MSKRTWNPMARDTALQINSTLDMLQGKTLSISYNEVKPVDATQHYCQITWSNHFADRANAGKAFTRLEQYLHILRNNSYHCLLFDGSLIRANFEFEDDILLAQNLLWWPAPYDYGNLLQEGYSPVELVSDFYGDSRWYESIKMRSPIRIDFDSSQHTSTHTQSHMHIQQEETRLNTNRPICFNRFIDFIFRNFYPQFDIAFSEFDFLEYHIPTFSKVTCAFSEVVI